MKHYVIHVFGCVEPSIVFKGANAEHRDRYARAFRNSKNFDMDSDALFWLDINSKGDPKVGSFSARFMDEDADAVKKCKICGGVIEDGYCAICMGN